MPIDPLATAYLDDHSIGGHARIVFEVAYLIDKVGGGDIELPRAAVALMESRKRVKERRAGAGPWRGDE